MKTNIDALTNSLSGTLKPEKLAVSLGFMPLTDCAPLVVARQMGFFEKHGLDVTLSREGSWATIRDKILMGVLDGGHVLAPMPLAATLGLIGHRPMVVGCALGLNGNAVTLGASLWDRLQPYNPSPGAMSAAPIRRLIDETGARPKFGVVFPTSMHSYQLRYWLADAGINPDTEVDLIPVPPPRMVETLAAGEIDGFCVGDPWNQQAVALGVGRIAIAGCELWSAAPEKVLGVTAAWAEANPGTHLALIRAIVEASAWADAPENVPKLAEMLADDRVLAVSPRAILPGLVGRYPIGLGEGVRLVPGFHLFHASAANFPWLSHARWILGQMRRWGQIPPDVDLETVARTVWRPDLYRAAVAPLGMPVPPTDSKAEGGYATPWSLRTATRPIPMIANRFFDGAVFDDAATPF